MNNSITVQLLRRAIAWLQRMIPSGQAPDSKWTKLSILVQLAGFALCAIVYSVLVGVIPFMHSLGGFWNGLIIMDLSVVTWAYIMFYTPWYSWWFIENKPGYASVGRSKGADGVTKNADGSFKGLYAFKGAWQGKLPWIQPFMGFKTTSVIVINNDSDPLEVILLDRRRLSISYRFDLSPMLDRLCALAFMDDAKIINDFVGETGQRIVAWCAGKLEQDLFAGLDEHSNLRIALAKVYGEDEVPSDFEIARSTQIKCITFQKTKQDAATMRLDLARTTVDTIGTGLDTLKTRFTQEQLERMDPGLLLYFAANATTEIQGEPFVIIGGGGVDTEAVLRYRGGNRNQNQNRRGN